MKAKEFKIQWKLNRKFGFVVSEPTWAGLVYTEKELTEFAEAYHQHRVNAISDKDINNLLGLAAPYGARWFKEQLLKK